MRDLVLHLCLRAFPAETRDRDGRVIVDLARDLSDQGRFAVLREAGGLLVGGLRTRAKDLWLDVAGAPWRAARERLVFPLGVAMLCVMAAFATSVVQPQMWPVYPGPIPSGPLAWAVLGVAGAVGVVVGTAWGRRRLAVCSSLLLLALMTVAVFAELIDHGALWSGSISHVAVDVFVLWLPVAVLLSLCALTVGERRTPTRPGAIPAACTAVAASAVLGLAPALVPTAWVPIPWWWSDALGGAFVYVPLLVVAATAVVALIRRDPVAKTSAALLVGASCFPVVWLLPATIHIMPDSWFSSSLWFLCYAPGVMVICLVMWALLPRRWVRGVRLG